MIKGESRETQKAISGKAKRKGSVLTDATASILQCCQRSNISVGAINVTNIPSPLHAAVEKETVDAPSSLNSE